MENLNFKILGITQFASNQIISVLLASLFAVRFQRN
jgi:hypothetical protein